MIIYVSGLLFFLPACVLCPIFYKMTHMKTQFSIRRDISADFLDQENSDNEIDEAEILHESPLSSQSASLSSLENCHRPSKATLEFLKTDSNLPRTLFTLCISNTLGWMPFFVSILISTVIVMQDYFSSVFYGVLWWGFGQSPITPILIYILSDRVTFIISQQCRGAAVSSIQKRVRRLTLVGES